MIVFGGCVGIEKAARESGYKIRVPFTAGRTDVSQEETDIKSFDVLEPKADGFRNYLKLEYSMYMEELLVYKAELLTFTAPKVTVLLGGMRVLNANYKKSSYGVFTNDFFVNLLDMDTVWKPSSSDEEVFEGFSIYLE